MTRIVTGSDPLITGTDDADVIFQYVTSQNPVTINAGDGNDLVVGATTPPLSLSGGADTLQTAESIDAADAWYLGNNPLAGSNVATPSTRVVATGDDALYYFSVTVGAREAIFVDVDFASGGFGGPAWDSRIQLLDATGSTVLADNNDSSFVDIGSFPTNAGATSTRDSYLSYSNVGDTPVTFYIVIGANSANGPAAIPSGDNFVLSVSVTGHDNVGTIAAEPVTLNGQEGDDFLLGGGGNDTIDGGTGNDTLNGGDGDDRFVIRTGDGIDTIAGGNGDDTLDLTNATTGWEVNLAGGGGRDNHGGIVATSGLETVLGTAFGDTLIASNASESLFGMGSDDIIVASNILDNRGTLDGGDGVDTLDLRQSVEPADDYDYPYRIDLVAGTTSEGDVIRNFENLVSGATADFVIGTSGDNVISTGNGGDTIDAGGGNDTIDTGSDDDTIIIGTGDGHDTIAGGYGTDTLDLTTATDGWYIDLNNGNGRDTSGDTLALSGIEVVRGSNERDTLIAGPGVNPQFTPALYGLGGDDTIIAGITLGGTLDGGSGTDTIDIGTFGQSNQPLTINLATGTSSRGDIILNFENVISGNAADQVTGTNGANIIATGNSDDVIHAGAGADTIKAGNGNDTLDGGAGADLMIGGNNDDTYIVDNVGDTVFEKAGAGDDLVRSRIDYALGVNVENLVLFGPARSGTGNALDNHITGSAGADRLAGVGGNDTIMGGRGDDRIFGGDGNDTIIGGIGQDTLTGGSDADVFRFADGDTGRITGKADTITDFRQREGDTIDLSAIDAIAGTAKSEAFRFIGTDAFSGHAGQLRYAFSGNDTLVMGDTDGNGRADFFIRLSGHVALTLDDFAGVRAANAPIGGDAVVAHDLVI